MYSILFVLLYALNLMALPAGIPSNTKVILQLDGIDRYYFTFTTNPKGLNRNQLEVLSRQGEFGVIQQNLVKRGDPAEVKRFNECFISSGMRESQKKTSEPFSLEAIATLCLASKTTELYNGYVHVQKSGKSPERLSILTTTTGFNSSLDRHLPSINKNGDRNLVKITNEEFKEKNKSKYCELRNDPQYCRSCSRFDNEKNKYAQLSHLSSFADHVFAATGEAELERLKRNNMASSVNALVPPEKLKNLINQYNKDPRVDVSTVMIQYNPLQKHFDFCMVCSAPAKINSEGECIFEGGSCRLGKALAKGYKCAEKCEDGKFPFEGVCRETCQSSCEVAGKTIAHLEQSLRSLMEREKNYIGSNRYLKKYLDDRTREIEIRKLLYQKQADQCRILKLTNYPCEHALRGLLKYEEAQALIEKEKDCSKTDPRNSYDSSCTPIQCLECKTGLNANSDYLRLIDPASCEQRFIYYGYDILFGRFADNADLLFQQCTQNRQVELVETCRKMAYPTLNDIYNVLRENGISCGEASSGSENTANFD